MGVNQSSTSSGAPSHIVTSTSGCGFGVPSGYSGNTTSVTLASGRVFYYHLPVNYNGTSPLSAYFSFHGGSKSPLEQEGLSGLSDPYFNPNGIAVYPQGEELTAGSGEYYFLPNPNVSEQTPNDLDFTLDVLSWLDSNLCVNSNQIYATGKSDGGGLVNLLACNATTAGQFAAFASVSGAYYEDKLAKACNPGRPVPFVAFHGLNDTTIPYNGKNAGTTKPDFQKTYPIDQWLQGWIARDGLYPTPVNNTGLYGGLVTESQWSGSGFANLLTFYKENDLGHVWPSTLPNDDCPQAQSPKCPLGHYTFNATTVIVDFLNQWQLPAAPSWSRRKIAFNA